jgi:hypothetical protein
MSAINDNPLGGVELTSVGTFGVREAALAGVAVPPGATGGVFADTSTLAWIAHPTCSGGTLTIFEESYMDRRTYDSE